MRIAIDNETFLISRTKPLPRVVCTAIQWGEAAEDGVLMKRGGELLRFLSDALDNPEVEFCGCNIAYDFGTLAATWPELIPRIFEAYRKGRVLDIALRQQLFDIALGRTFADDKLTIYSLASLAKLIFGEHMKGKSSITGDGWRLRFGELDDVPLERWPAEAAEYARNDALTTLRICNAQDDAADLMKNAPFQAYSYFCLTLASARGMITDPVAVRECERHHQSIMRDAEPRLIAAGLLVNGVKKIAPAAARIEAACAAKGVPVPKTKTGKTATDKAACLISGDELMLLRSSYVSAEKVLSTYIPALVDGSQGLPITTRYHLAATGRTTSATPSEPLRGANLQQQPRKGGIRECFVPRPGYVFMSGDFAGAELHCLAQVCKERLGWTTLGDLLNAGKDIHAWVASYLIRKTYEETVALIEAGDSAAVNARQEAKAANFGFPGGMGVGTFIEAQLKQAERFWDYADVARLKKVWLEALPEINEYFDMVKHELGPDEQAVLLLPDGFTRLAKGFTTAANTYFQARAAAGAKRAIQEVTRRCYAVKGSALRGCFPVNFIHDEKILEVPDVPSIYRPALAEFEHVMADAFNAIVPDYPTHVDAVLMRRWSKKAKKVQTPEGVIPWEP